MNQVRDDLHLEIKSHCQNPSWQTIEREKLEERTAVLEQEFGAVEAMLGDPSSYGSVEGGIAARRLTIDDGQLTTRRRLTIDD